MNGTSATLQDEWYIREAAGLRLLSALQSMAAGTGPGEYSSWPSLRDAYVSQSEILTELRSRAETQNYLPIRDAAGALIMEIEVAFNAASAQHAGSGGITLNPVAPKELDAGEAAEGAGFAVGSLLIPGLVILAVILLVRAL